jgi:hypothetical protein
VQSVAQLWETSLPFPRREIPARIPFGIDNAAVTGKAERRKPTDQTTLFRLHVEFISSRRRVSGTEIATV